MKGRNRHTAGLTPIVIVALFATACSGGASPTSPSAGETVTNLSIIGTPLVEAGSGPYFYIATVRYSNLTSADVTSSATWTSSNNQIAAFTTLGGVPVLNTFRSGTVTITASYGGRTATQNVTVGGSTPNVIPSPDSIRLTSMTPSSGATLSRSQTVTFTGTLGYSLASADSGTVTLVIQNQANQVLQPAGSQPRTTVARGSGQVTLSQSIAVPATGTTSVTVFFSVTPSGSVNTNTVASASYTVQQR